MIHSDILNSDRWARFSLLFAVCFFLIGACLIYVAPYLPRQALLTRIVPGLLWSSAYLPLIILPWKAQWNVEDIGFAFNWKAGLVTIVIALILVLAGSSRELLWSNAAMEAFARTAEEVFFRGFLFTLIFRLTTSKPRPWMWAIVGSSLAFTLVHTQTFQAGGVISQGFFPVLSRLINLFVFAAVLGVIRWRTQSVLPAAITHATFNGGLQTIPFVLVLYVIGWIWIKAWQWKDRDKLPEGDGAA